MNKENKASGGFSLVNWEKTILKIAKELQSRRVKPSQLNDEYITRQYNIVTGKEKEKPTRKEVWRGIAFIALIIWIIVFAILIILQ